MACYGKLLIVNKEGDEYVEFVLNKKSCTIGRDKNCDIRIVNKEISRKHAEVYVDSNTNTVWLSSQGRDPVHLNGQPVTEPTELSPGDKIEVQLPQRTRLFIYEVNDETVQFAGTNVTDTVGAGDVPTKNTPSRKHGPSSSKENVAPATTSDKATPKPPAKHTAQVPRKAAPPPPPPPVPGRLGAKLATHQVNKPAQAAAPSAAKSTMQAISNPERKLVPDVGELLKRKAGLRKLKPAKAAETSGPEAMQVDTEQPQQPLGNCGKVPRTATTHKTKKTVRFAETPEGVADDVTASFAWSHEHDTEQVIDIDADNTFAFSRWAMGSSTGDLSPALATEPQLTPPVRKLRKSLSSRKCTPLPQKKFRESLPDEDDTPNAMDTDAPIEPEILVDAVAHNAQPSAADEPAIGMTTQPPAKPTPARQNNTALTPKLQSASLSKLLNKQPATSSPLSKRLGTPKTPASAQIPKVSSTRKVASAGLVAGNATKPQPSPAVKSVARGTHGAVRTPKAAPGTAVRQSTPMVSQNRQQKANGLSAASPVVQQATKGAAGATTPRQIQTRVVQAGKTPRQTAAAAPAEQSPSSSRAHKATPMPPRAKPATQQGPSQPVSIPSCQQVTHTPGTTTLQRTARKSRLSKVTRAEFLEQANAQEAAPIDVAMPDATPEPQSVPRFPTPVTGAIVPKAPNTMTPSSLAMRLAEIAAQSDTPSKDQDNTDLPMPQLAVATSNDANAESHPSLPQDADVLDSTMQMEDFQTTTSTPTMQKVVHLPAGFFGTPHDVMLVIKPTPTAPEAHGSPRVNSSTMGSSEHVDSAERQDMTMVIPYTVIAEPVSTAPASAAPNTAEQTATTAAAHHPASPLQPSGIRAISAHFSPQTCTSPHNVSTDARLERAVSSPRSTAKRMSPTFAFNTAKDAAASPVALVWCTGKEVGTQTSPGMLSGNLNAAGSDANAENMEQDRDSNVRDDALDGDEPQPGAVLEIGDGAIEGREELASGDESEEEASSGSEIETEEEGSEEADSEADTEVESEDESEQSEESESSSESESESDEEAQEDASEVKAKLVQTEKNLQGAIAVAKSFKKKSRQLQTQVDKLTRQVCMLKSERRSLQFQLLTQKAFLDHQDLDDGGSDYHPPGESENDEEEVPGQQAPREYEVDDDSEEMSQDEAVDSEAETEVMERDTDESDEQTEESQDESESDSGISKEMAEHEKQVVVVRPSAVHVATPKHNAQRYGRVVVIRAAQVAKGTPKTAGKCAAVAFTRKLTPVSLSSKEAAAAIARSSASKTRFGTPRRFDHVSSMTPQVMSVGKRAGGGEVQQLTDDTEDVQQQADAVTQEAGAQPGEVSAGAASSEPHTSEASSDSESTGDSDTTDVSSSDADSEPPTEHPDEEEQQALHEEEVAQQQQQQHTMTSDSESSEADSEESEDSGEETEEINTGGADHTEAMDAGGQVEEVDDVEDGAEEQGEEEEVEEGQTEEADVCSVCRTVEEGDVLIICDGCELFFHLTCCKPMLRKVPKGAWFCAACKVAKTSRTHPSRSSRPVQQENAGKEKIATALKELSVPTRQNRRKAVTQAESLQQQIRMTRRRTTAPSAAPPPAHSKPTVQHQQHPPAPPASRPAARPKRGRPAIADEHASNALSAVDENVQMDTENVPPPRVVAAEAERPVKRSRRTSTAVEAVLKENSSVLNTVQAMPMGKSDVVGKVGALRGARNAADVGVSTRRTTRRTRRID